MASDRDPLTPEARAELRRLAVKATARPWVYPHPSNKDISKIAAMNRGRYAIVATSYLSWKSSAQCVSDAEFITATANAALPLLDALDAAEVERDAICELCREAANAGGALPEELRHRLHAAARPQ